jgi:DNA-binding SARP family transcriptional activator
VEFRLLGDVEHRLDGRLLDTGHARRRGVLGALLVDVGRPVPAERLIDRVWRSAAVPGPLAAYVSRLRGSLVGADGEHPAALDAR